MSSNQSIAKALLAQLQEFDKEVPQVTIPAIKEYKSKEMVFQINHRPKGLYFVESGNVKIFVKDKEGKESILRFAGANQFIGYVSLIKRWDYTASAETLEDSKIQFIPKHIFLTLLQKDVKFANSFVEIMCTHIHEQDKQYSGMKVKQRLAVLLLSLEMASDEDHKYDGSEIHVPRKDIASAIGTTPESVSRILTELKEEKILIVTTAVANRDC